MVECEYCKKKFNNIRGANAHKGIKHKEELLDRKVRVENGRRGWEILNISVREINSLRRNHSGKCGICGKEETVKTNKSSIRPNLLSIDHDHETKEFRGFLCVQCNRSLGWYERYSSEIETYLS